MFRDEIVYQGIFHEKVIFVRLSNVCKYRLISEVSVSKGDLKNNFLIFEKVFSNCLGKLISEMDTLHGYDST